MEGMSLVQDVFLLQQEWWHKPALGSTSPTNLQPLGCSFPLHSEWLELGQKFEHPSLGASPEEPPR